jgi:hypothetical protein
MDIELDIGMMVDGIYIGQEMDSQMETSWTPTGPRMGELWKLID